MSDWSDKKVVVVMGGESSEREISLRTGNALADALARRGVAAERLDLTRRTVAELVALDADVVLVAMHGWQGEGGPLQGLLEMLHVPYTGSGVLASALAMDKVRTKQVLEAVGVPTPRWTVAAAAADVAAFGLPCVVKPSLEGSSVGVSIVRRPEEIAPAFARCRQGAGAALVENFVAGRELTVRLFDGRVMGCVEVTAAEGFYDFEAKYVRGDTRYVYPAPLEPALEARVAEVARRAYEAVGCRGVARVDVLLDAQQRPYVLEVNTVPGMTATSLVPKIAAGNGIAFEDFALMMLDAATTDAATLGTGGASR